MNEYEYFRARRPIVRLIMFCLTHKSNWWAFYSRIPRFFFLWLRSATRGTQEFPCKKVSISWHDDEEACDKIDLQLMSYRPPRVISWLKLTSLSVKPKRNEVFVFAYHSVWKIIKNVSFFSFNGKIQPNLTWNLRVKLESEKKYYFFNDFSTTVLC